jgi:ubiquitin C-terminal hydrolase
MKLTHLSKILIISFQRVNQKTGRKNNSYVEFPNNLNMKKYSEKGIPNIYSYDLFGIINHSGTMNSGHYTAIIKINNNWYEFNDSKVRKVEIRKNYIVSNLVYCLYYIKK